jgi:3-oxoacyl-[acyl-carrier protein] reductase
VKLGIEGRRAVVGASSEGLGLATAMALAEEGAQVLVCGRDRAKLDAAVERIGASASSFVADLSSVAGAHALAGHALDTLGQVDILVPNVGGPPAGLAQTTDLEQLRASLDRCLLSMAALCQDLLPGMRERKWGRILAITSSGVREPLPGMVYSNASRAGLTGYLKTLASEVIADGVTVNSILPSGQLTKRLETMIGKGLDAFVASLPAGRAGDPRDFGRVAAFLCSEPANYVTGVALPVDGGSGRGLA